MGRSRLARVLWAAPASLVGLLLAPFFRRHYVSRGVVLCEGAVWPRKLGWRYRAITLGHVVLSVHELDRATFRHELVHVGQYERLGPLMFIAYPLASLQAKLRGGHHYRDNRFEVEARRTIRGARCVAALGGSGASGAYPGGFDQEHRPPSLSPEGLEQLEHASVVGPRFAGEDPGHDTGEVEIPRWLRPGLRKPCASRQRSRDRGRGGACSRFRASDDVISHASSRRAACFAARLRMSARERSISKRWKAQ